jgi:hypothetical protein
MNGQSSRLLKTKIKKTKLNPRFGKNPLASAASRASSRCSFKSSEVEEMKSTGTRAIVSAFYLNAFFTVPCTRGEHHP